MHFAINNMHVSQFVSNHDANTNRYWIIRLSKLFVC